MLHGQTRYNMKSRFFDELPEGALKWLTPPRPAMPASTMGRGWNNDYAMKSGATQAGSAWAPGTFDSKIVRKEDLGHGLTLKQKVFHAKFGEGIVLTLEGAGDDARAQINFPRHGTKWLALSVAKLTPVP